MSKDDLQEWNGFERTKHKQRMRKNMMQPRPDGLLLNVKRKQADVRTENRRKRREQDKRNDEEHPQSTMEEWINENE